MLLREARIAAGKTLKHVARSVGTNIGNLSRIERGQVPGRELGDRLIGFYEGAVSWADFYDSASSVPPASEDGCEQARAA